MISLGCPKNLVDTEVMLGALAKDNYEITANAQDADVMIINTCAFIEDSKKESIDTILETARLKTEGKLQKLIVTGCLAQRYKDDLEASMPEVDHFIGTGEFSRITEFAKVSELPIARSAVAPRPLYLYDYATPRISTLPAHTSYVKIAEGCSRTCSFCIIPKLRGKGRSRAIDSIVKEVQMLADKGTKEVNLIAQDLTAYGIDRDDPVTLEMLMRELVGIKGIAWFRLMYNYPMYFTDGLVELIANSSNICKYLDMPLQHIDSELLATMRRKVDEKEVRSLLKRLRSDIPNLTMRSSFIVGFPGETEDQFKKLYDFIEETEFDKVGVFTYSQEEGTAAGRMPNQLSQKIKDKRKDKIMSLQQKISKKKNDAMLGKKLKVLIDRFVSESDEPMYQGRTEGQALDIDGQVFIKSKKLPVGEFVNVEVTGTAEYDLFANVL